jgi:phosphoglycerol transferase
MNMPLEGTSTDYFYSYFRSAFCPSVIVLVLEILIFIMPISKKFVVHIGIRERKFCATVFPVRLKKYMWGILCIVWLAILILNADKKFKVYEFIKSQLDSSTFIEEEYVDANDVNIVFPEQKRNLICIYMESAETSMQDKANGGLLDENLIPEMTELAKNNISFSQSELLEGATVAPDCGWTVAGLVAQTSGLPLKLYAYDADNSMGKYAYFMPGATTLGDILEKEGYYNIFMAGSDMHFAGRREYFMKHGNYEIWDYSTAIDEGKIPESYKVAWGFEDKKLYEFAEEKLLELAAGEQPFNFSMLTVDTHSNGYVCELCPDIYDDDYYNIWTCASKQVYDFVEWIKQQDFYENTTICITGDHCSMQPGFLSEYEYDKYEGGGVRKVYNVIINSAVQPSKMKNRNFATIDMFPTVLASLGAEIEGERLGLGTNLFSDVPTILEEYGSELVITELNKKSSFYNQNILFKN